MKIRNNLLEKLHWIVLPTFKLKTIIRLKKIGFNQKTISKRLNVTESCVSQLIQRKRGTYENYSEKELQHIDNLVSQINLEEENLELEILKKATKFFEMGDKNE